jgi:hypothetical protein
MSTDDNQSPAVGPDPTVRKGRDRVANNDLVHAAAREGDVSAAAFLPAAATAAEIKAVRARIVSQLDRAANQRQQTEEQADE